MRFLTTCLLLFCFQSFVVCTVEDGSLTFAQTKISKIKESKISPLNCNKLALNQFIETRVEFSTTIQHHLKNQINVIFNIVGNGFTSDNNAYKSLSNYAQYKYNGYTLILNYLYPKHTFW